MRRYIMRLSVKLRAGYEISVNYIALRCLKGESEISMDFTIRLVRNRILPISRSFSVLN